MCKQPSANCLNRYCNGFAQTLALLPCEASPNCELKRTRIPRTLRSAERYCPECRILTREDRRELIALTWRYNRATAKRTNGAVHNAPAGAEQDAESSGIAEGRGAVGDGSLVDLNDPVSTSEEANGNTFSQDEQSTGHVNGSDESMVDNASANGEVPFTNSFLDAIYDPQEITLGAFFPVSDDAATQTVDSSSPALDLHATGPDPVMALGDLPTTHHLSGPSKQAATNPLSSFSWNGPSPEFPVYSPSSPQESFDPTLPQMDPTYDSPPWYIP